MPGPRSYPLEIIRDHLIARVNGSAFLLDTGSPVTLRPPALVSEQLGQAIRYLVGNDVMARRRVTLDWRRREVTLDAPVAAGATLELRPHMGLWQMEVAGDHGREFGFLDSGAAVSYAPASAVRGRQPIGRRRDFYIGLGTYEVDVYELVVRIGSRRFRGEFAVLPDMLTMLLSAIGGSGWIIGSAFFEDRCIQLDFANDRLVDATPARPRMTVPTVERTGAVRTVDTVLQA